MEDEPRLDARHAVAYPLQELTCLIQPDPNVFKRIGTKANPDRDCPKHGGLHIW